MCRACEPSVPEAKPGPLARGGMFVVWIYRRFITVPLHASLGPAAGCRFEPSCSAYAYDAIRIHGFFKGSLLGAWRILRCNPFVSGGHDPVPPR